jgi:predicted PurR-regulated permease PerM
LPFIFAFIVAYLLAPIVRRLQPKVTRVGGVILVYLVIVAVLAAFFGFLLPAVTQDLVRLRDAAPAAMDKLNSEWIRER